MPRAKEMTKFLHAEYRYRTFEVDIARRRVGPQGVLRGMVFF
jgi:hypothetical protein